MAITPQQKTAITAKLSVSLSALTDDKLIELCLLYRSAPEALPTFPDLLATEITRRFTAAEIAANDVMFSVIQNFSNQFNPDLTYKEKLYKFANALDRELWMSENISFFEATLLIPSRVEWLVTESAVFNAVLISPIASNKLFNSSEAMAAIAASSVAMTVIAASSVALLKITPSTAARNAFMANNTVFQNVKQQIYNTVKASWTKKAGLSDYAPVGVLMSTINSAITSPSGFVFATLGYSAGYPTARSELKHPNGQVAASLGTAPDQLVMGNVDVVSFNGAVLTARISNARAFAELWSPT